MPNLDGVKTVAVVVALAGITAWFNRRKTISEQNGAPQRDKDAVQTVDDDHMAKDVFISYGRGESTKLVSRSSTPPLEKLHFTLTVYLLS